VMKDGVVVEQDRADALMAAPREEYTRKLMAALPRGYQRAG
jgi:peptide/nickel transport system ATP-binding protein